MKSTRIKRILAAVILAAFIIIGIFVGKAIHNLFNPQPESIFAESVPYDENPIKPSAAISEDCAAAYNAVIGQYRAALNLSELDWQSNAETHMQTYPLINPAYVGFFHMGMLDTLYAACCDIDGNGTDELFIGIGDDRDAMEVGVYAFNGSEAVTLSLTDTPNGYQILTDGTFIQGDKGGIILTVKHISPNGFTLEDTETPDIQHGVSLQDIDLSARGGNLTLENWEEIPLK